MNQYCKNLAEAYMCSSVLTMLHICTYSRSLLLATLLFQRKRCYYGGGIAVANELFMIYLHICFCITVTCYLAIIWYNER